MSRGRATGAFAALLEAAATEREAALGLVGAYGELSVDERAAVLDLVLDGRGDERASEEVVALLSLLEEDPALSARLTAALAPRAVIAHRWGTEAAGGAHLRAAAEPEVALRVDWDGDDVDVAVAAPVPAEARPSDARSTVDAVAERLWAYRRAGGELPPGAACAAALFDP